MPTTDLIRKDWYARTVDLMSEATITANRATLYAQLRPGFTWDSGRPLTDLERLDTGECIEILDAETRRRTRQCLDPDCTNPDCDGEGHEHQYDPETGSYLD